MLWCDPKNPATLFVKNQSSDTIIFVHTAECGDDTTTCVQGPIGNWKEAPVKAGTEVSSGADDFKIGKANTVFMFPDKYRIYFKYKSQPDVIVYIYMIIVGTGFQVGMSAYNAKKAESFYNSAELIDVYGWKAQIVLRIPPVTYWRTLTRPLTVQIDQTSLGEVGIGLMHVSLSTIITACFVVPGYGGAAVVLTFIEGLVQFLSSSIHKQQRNEITHMKEMLEVNKDAIKRAKLEDLRGHIIEAAMKFEEPNLGLNVTMTNIANAINKMNPINLEDGIKSDIIRCVDTIGSFVAETSDLQKSLSNCLNTTMDPEGLLPPSKVWLGVLFSAISVTMNAFAYGSMLHNFVEADTGGWKPTSEKTREILDIFTAENILSWMFVKRQTLQSFNIKQTAKAARIGLVQVDWFHTPEHGHELYLQDVGLAKAEWGSGDLKSASDIVKELTYHDRSLPGLPFWKQFILDTDIGERDQAKKLYGKYDAYIQGQIDADYEKVITSALTDLEQSGVPYLPLLGKPLAPLADRPITSSMQYAADASTAAMVPKFCYIKYGYGFANPGRESSILWQTEFIKIESRVATTADGKTTYETATGMVLCIPKDPWNAKAIKYADTVNKRADKKDLGYKTLLPPYSSAQRVLWRQLSTTAEPSQITKETTKEECVTYLDNSQPEEFTDVWTVALLDKKELSIRLTIKRFNFPLYGLPNTLHESGTKKHGIEFVPEAFVDLNYSTKGHLLGVWDDRKIELGEMYEVTKALARSGGLPSVDKEVWVDLGVKGKPFSVCIHSDFERCLENLEATRRAVDEGE